jgi:hypothetical protein
LGGRKKDEANGEMKRVHQQHDSAFLPWVNRVSSIVLQKKLITKKREEKLPLFIPPYHYFLNEKTTCPHNSRIRELLFTSLYWTIVRPPKS